MESSDDVEVLSRAIEKLLDEKRKREADGDIFIEDDDDHLLLSRLFSQLESSTKPRKKTDETTKEEEEEEEQFPDSSLSKEDKRHLEESIEDMAKDIKKMKRQNTVTQVLLSAMILLTLTWQLSEYSMIFMIKDRLSHPVRSIGGMLSGIFKGKIKNQLHGTSTSKEQDNNLNNCNNGTNNGAHLQVHELLRELGFNDDDD